MGDVLVKMAGLVVLAVALIIFPIVMATQLDENTAHRYTQNSVQNYLDIITDKGEINPKDYASFIVDLHASGLSYDVKIVREQRLVYNAEVVYVAHDVISPNSGDFTTAIKMRQGDKVAVEVQAVGRTQGERIAYSAFGLYLPDVYVRLERINRN